MNTKRTILGSLATLATAAILTLGIPTAANAFDYPNQKALPAGVLTATPTSVTVNLGTVQYADPTITGIYITVLQNGGGGYNNECDPLTSTPPLGSYCWSESDGGSNGVIRTNLNGTYTYSGLKPNTNYEIEVYAYETTANEDFFATIKTPADPHAAPTHKPTVHINYANLKTTVHIPAEHDTKGVKFNLYAHYKGAWHRVEHKVADNKTYTLTKLPTRTAIYFAVTALRKNGETLKSANSTSIYRDWAAPTAPTYQNGGIKGYIYPDHQTTYWKAAKPGSGHITKYVLYAAIQNGPTVAKHTYKATTRHGTITGLTNGTTYIFTLYVYNSHGKKVMYDQLIGTYR